MALVRHCQSPHYLVQPEKILESQKELLVISWAMYSLQSTPNNVQTAKFVRFSLRFTARFFIYYIGYTWNSPVSFTNIISLFKMHMWRFIYLWMLLISIEPIFVWVTSNNYLQTGSHCGKWIWQAGGDIVRVAVLLTQWRVRISVSYCQLIIRFTKIQSWRKQLFSGWPTCALWQWTTTK